MDRSRTLPRRAAMIGAAGGAAAFLALRACAARAEAGPLFVVCRVHPAMGAGIALVDEHAAAVPGPSLPARGHGICLRPGTAEAVVFARRPGTFAAVFEPTTGLVVRRFDTPPERHFYGHGVFEPTGRVLVTTENDTSRGQGVLGLYDAADGYRRIGELPAHGIGPHDIALLPDGRTLAVANGGILTLPESGRDKLNLDSMRPSLNRIELASGRLLDEGRLSDRLHRLSIRHLAQAEGGLIAAGLQWEGEPGDLVPLVAIDRGMASRRLTPRRTFLRRWRPISAASPSTAPARSSGRAARAATASPSGAWLTAGSCARSRSRTPARSARPMRPAGSSPRAAPVR